MSIFTYIRSHTVLASSIAIVVVAGVIIAGQVASRTKATEANQSNITKVTLVEARSFRGGASSVSADGIVESVSQVDLKSQVSAPLAAVNVAVGDTVYAGQVIATLQNADIRAQLDQARATLQLAQGQYSSGGVSLDIARKNAIDKIRDAYTKSYDTVHTKLDSFLSSNTGTSPQLYSFITEWKLADGIRETQQDLGQILRDWKQSIDSLSPESSDTAVLEAIGLSEKNLARLNAHLDLVSKGMTDAARTTTGTELALVNGWQSLVAGAQVSVTTAIANMTAAENSFSNARISIGSSANAQVSAAQAGVKNLEAQLAKTIIISPISGKLAALPLRTGELASPGQLIATVVGGGGLQVKAYASGEDITRIKTGARATIRGTVSGLVVNVAPSVNQLNKKVEVKVSVTDSASSGLVIGQNVPVSIDATVSDAAAAVNSYLLPIQNVKIVPGDAYVFTVDAESKIVQHAVILGSVQGGFVEVKSGLTDDMQIVTPVYELVEGQEVSVQR
jgi:multidrug efflux pump subunit AcrA (membrane-fusion protein)